MLRLCAITLSLGVLFVTWTAPAIASHFRFGHVTWIARPDISPTSVEFTVRHAWRRSACGGTGPGGLVDVGDPACPFANFLFGDVGSTTLTGTVIAIDVSADWFTAAYTVTHTYPSGNNGGSPWLAEITTCCRIYSPQVNAPGTGFRVQTTVDLTISNSSPVSTVFPIIPMGVNATTTIAPPIGDADGESLS